MKDAIYFQMTGDVEAGDRIAPPHPELTRYFEPPREVIKDLVESGIDAKLVEAMGVKKGQDISLGSMGLCFFEYLEDVDFFVPRAFCCSICSGLLLDQSRVKLSNATLPTETRQKRPTS